MTDTTTQSPSVDKYSTLEKILGVVVALLIIAFIAGSCQYKKTTDTIDTLTVQNTTTKTQLDQVSKEKDDLEKSVASSSIVIKTYAKALDGKGNPIYNYKYVKTASSTESDNKGLTVTSDGTSTSNSSTTTKTHEVKVTQQGVPINGVAFVSTSTDIFQGKLKGLDLGVSHALLFDVWVGAEIGASDISNISGTFETKVLLGAGIP